MNSLDPNDKILIKLLIDSYARQLVSYQELCSVSQQILSKLILSRGDISVIKNGFTKKKELLDKLENERSQVSAHVQVWQDVKDKIPNCQERDTLCDLLTKVEKAIATFLDSEEQLRIHLERIMRKGTDHSQ